MSAAINGCLKDAINVSEMVGGKTVRGCKGEKKRAVTEGENVR